MNPAEKLKKMTFIGQKVAKIIQILQKKTRVGVSGIELDLEAKKLMDQEGVFSSCFNYKSQLNQEAFPYHICISVNSDLTHGLPNEKLFCSGDLISLDVACYLLDEEREYHADSAITFVLEENHDLRKNKLIEVTKACLLYVIGNIIPNSTTTSDIGAMIDNFVSSRGFYSIREFGGHGIGSRLHQEPFIPNYKPKNYQKFVLKTGMFICVEPLIQENDRKIDFSSNQ